MNSKIITGLQVAILIAIPISLVLVSCQPKQKENPANPTDSKDTVISKNIKPAESGYADVNGLKMYYEVYGNGKPIVLIHGSYMNIPLNWTQIIPLLSKDRKVIVAEMQAHGR